jgi:hypothetical protein
MIFSFFKIQKKVNKVCIHWEKANIIGELADIPVYVFRKIMEDVLASFLVHRANTSGV